jgi:uncharacterized OB-fold protein
MNLAPLALSTDGVLYSWTTVHASSTRPTPYTIGYVDLPEGVRLLADIVSTPSSASFDAQVRLVTDDEGAWAFSFSDAERN